MANDYIINKWRQWFRSVDISRRGVIYKTDVNDEEVTFAHLSNMDEDQKKKMKENLDKIWDDVVFRGRSGGICEEDFVELNTKLYNADKTKFQEEMRKGYSTFFTDIVDVDHDGSITEDDYVNIMRACGHENIALDKKFFGLYNPVDGKVHVKVLIDSWVQFTSSNDSSKRDIVKEGIESGV